MLPHKVILPFAALLMLLSPVAARATSTASLVEKGNTLYHQGKYEDALKAYDEASVDAPESPQILFNKGAADYRMDNYDKAENAWQQAAVKSEDPILSAKAFFNLGNCAFAEARRQQDSDPKKAVSDCTQSVKYYQQALDLLKQQTDSQALALKKDASQNIEMVRLTMKSILDKLHKQEQEAKKQQAQQKQAQKKADNLKKLISRQQELINRDQYYAQDQQAKKDTKTLKKNITQMAKDQAKLQKETQDAAKDMTSAKTAKSDAAKTAGKHLEQAQRLQQKAVDQMKNKELSTAQKNQQAALDQMKKALSSLEKAAGENGQKKQTQTGGKQEKQASKAGQSGNQKQPSSAGTQQKNPAGMAQQTAQNQNSDIDQMPDTAQSIINQEQEHRQQLQRAAAAQGGYQDVDKDW